MELEDCEPRRLTRRERREVWRHMNRWERRAWCEGCIMPVGTRGDWVLTRRGHGQLMMGMAMAFLAWLGILMMVL